MGIDCSYVALVEVGGVTKSIDIGWDTGKHFRLMNALLGDIRYCPGDNAFMGEGITAILESRGLPDKYAKLFRPYTLGYRCSLINTSGKHDKIFHRDITWYNSAELLAWFETDHRGLRYWRTNVAEHNDVTISPEGDVSPIAEAYSFEAKTLEQSKYTKITQVEKEKYDLVRFPTEISLNREILFFKELIEKAVGAYGHFTLVLGYSN